MSDDRYDGESDAPTRPDLPAFMPAIMCAYCGKKFGEHAEMFPTDLAVKCLGIRSNFAPVEINAPE